jgi:hypothetical protein
MHRFNVSMEGISFEERVRSFSFDDLFEQRSVVPDLRGSNNKIRPGRVQVGQEHILKKSARQIFHKLFEMIYLLHLKQISLNGNFSYLDIIYIPLVDSYIIDEEVITHYRVRYSDVGYEYDMAALGEVLKKLLSLKWEDSSRGWRSGLYPIHVEHLLDTLKKFPANARSSLAFKAFLRNHIAMLSPGAVQALILEVHRYIGYQPVQQNLIQLMGRHYAWTSVASSVPCFSLVYLFQKIGYVDDIMSWFDFIRNCITHPTQKNARTKITVWPETYLFTVLLTFLNVTKCMKFAACSQVHS